MMRAIVIVAFCATGCDVFDVPDIGPLQATLPDSGDGVVLTRCSDSDPTADVSFSADIQPLTSRSPGGCSCHRTNTTSGFNLGTYANLRRGGLNSGTNVVIPGEPCASIIVQKIGLAPPFGARMPYNGPPYLTASEQQLVRDWIAEGAPDN